MNDLIPLRARPTRSDRSARVGMIVFIGGWTMMFGALLATYLLLRSGQPAGTAWRPPGLPSVERALPTLATVVLLSSSATLSLGVAAIRGARPRALTGYLVVTLALALGFLALQTTTWLHMMRRGLSPTGSLYATCFFGLTMFHALHVGVGIVGIAALVPRAHRGAFSAHAHTAVRNWAVYWHFVDVAWIAFFAAVVLW